MTKEGLAPLASTGTGVQVGASMVAARAVAGLGLASGVFHWLWLFALKHAGPARATVFPALAPPAAGLVGATWLGEWPGPELWLGMVAVGIGLRLATRALLSCAEDGVESGPR